MNISENSEWNSEDPLRQMRDRLYTLRESGRYEEALEMVAEILHAAPEDHDARFTAAQCLWMLHRRDEALELTRTLIGERPDAGRLYGLAADICADRQGWTEAAGYFERALELEPESYYYHLRLSQVLYEVLLEDPYPLQSRFFRYTFKPEYARLGERVLAEAETAIGLEPERAAGYAQKAAVLDLMLRPEESEAAIREAIACEPQGHYVRALHAHFLLKKGELKAAREEVDYALSLNPDNVDARQIRERIEEGARNPALLQKYWLERASYGTSEYFDRLEVRRRRILLILRAGRRPLWQMSRYLKRAPDDVDIQLAYGKALSEDKQPDRALRHFRRLQRRWPDNTDIPAWIGQLKKLGVWAGSIKPMLRRILYWGIAVPIVLIVYIPKMLVWFVQRMTGIGGAKKSARTEKRVG
ncbi:tetratricopeptide repeat protein [Saccharibacillus sp. CPCC 101409]|uniref:tetratricopeptide repeat protein n=1 Tax=Saccharibacillus sp. CPCC 101409 TaxID=3058041 RepID=UPI002670FB9C|nr:tetratricopeptide repeat protein [Saccharibacillus sp. CPCC 101409]MDO3408904.1 tetratricopeptide repeat protein [Saccharibacillus sp. CPCC 101409]